MVKKRKKIYLRPGQLAKQWSVSNPQITLWFNRGWLRGYRIPSTSRRRGHCRIELDSALEFAQKRGLPVPQVPQEKIYLRPGQLAKQWCVSSTLITLWFNRGWLRGYRIPSTSRQRGHCRIELDSALEFAQKHGLPVPQVPQERTNHE